MDFETCGEPHPNRPDLRCEHPAGRLHVLHEHEDPNDPHGLLIIWENRSYRAPSRSGGTHGTTRSHVQEQAKMLRERARDQDLPVARTNDPWTSQVAAERIEPKWGTRKHHVLVRVLEAEGAWVRGEEFTTAEVGGSEGLRRLRELRVEGFAIERRPAPTSETAWEYRLPR